MESVLSSWRLIDVLKWTDDYLRQKGVQNSRLETEWLIGHFLKMSRIDLYLNYDKPLKKSELGNLRNAIKERVTGKPLQLVLGSADFMGYEFRVSPDVLIPRSDTEKLVEVASGEISDNRTRRILDVGTGSGNIACSIAKMHGSTDILAIDINADAVSLAQKNAKLLGVHHRIRVEKVDFTKWTPRSSFDMILSNPPYVSEREYDELSGSVRDYEPADALVSGSDGLDFIRILLNKSKPLLKSGGTLIFEIGLGQIDTVLTLMKENEYNDIASYNDNSGIARVVKGTRA